MRNLIKYTIISLCTLIVLLITSCVKFPERPPEVPPEIPKEHVDEQLGYIYDFGNERQDIMAQITINTDGRINLEQIIAEIPALKYNKSWLFLLTQDDCKHAAFSSTWAAVNGKPLSKEFFYDAGHLRGGDFPPDTLSLGKTLGITDGTGKEVRFAFMTTLAPEYNWMDAETDVNVGFKGNNFRFYMKSGLTWDSVVEIVNSGNGIAFHDINATDVENRDTILKHFSLSQDIIKKRLSGRGCKILAEPNGNKVYISAAMSYGPIKLMTAQAEAEKLYPFKVKGNLHKGIVERKFYENEELKAAVLSELSKEAAERSAVHWGLHSTDLTTAEVLLWLNDTFGKDGDNSVWFPSLEEYYEYNYLRNNTTIQKSTESNSYKLTLYMPTEQYFYFPSLTINLKGIKAENIIGVNTSSEISGFSFANYGDGLMMNIDCRKFLVENAQHYVKLYENIKSKSNLMDALYHIDMLKDSEIKTGLLNRLK